MGYFRLVMRVIFAEVGIHPDFCFSLLREKDHLLGDVEEPNLLIEYLEPGKCCVVEIELISKRNVVNLFQSQVHLVHI